MDAGCSPRRTTKRCHCQTQQQADVTKLLVLYLPIQEKCTTASQKVEISRVDKAVEAVGSAIPIGPSCPLLCRCSCYLLSHWSKLSPPLKVLLSPPVPSVEPAQGDVPPCPWLGCSLGSKLGSEVTQTSVTVTFGQGHPLGSDQVLRALSLHGQRSHGFSSPCAAPGMRVCPPVQPPALGRWLARLDRTRGPATRPTARHKLPIHKNLLLSHRKGLVPAVNYPLPPGLSSETVTGHRLRHRLTYFKIQLGFRTLKVRQFFRDEYS